MSVTSSVGSRVMEHGGGGRVEMAASSLRFFAAGMVVPVIPVSDRSLYTLLGTLVIGAR